MMDQDGRPQGSTPPHPHRPRFTGVGFLEAGCRGAAPDGVSGVSPDFLPPSAPEGGVPKKPTFVKRGGCGRGDGTMAARSFASLRMTGLAGTPMVTHQRSPEAGSMGSEILRFAQDDRAGWDPDGHASAKPWGWLLGLRDPSLRSG